MRVVVTGGNGKYDDGYSAFAANYQDPRSAFDCTKMRTLFGWTPSWSWRDQLSADAG